MSGSISGGLAMVAAAMGLAASSAADSMRGFGAVMERVAYRPRGRSSKGGRRDRSNNHSPAGSKLARKAMRGTLGMGKPR